ncbi:VOC family protein [Nocardiopsis sp. MG754419]|uniref:VOC family protein n=1 Tax=Nocardiopsis sp. MG754419 TaxID=2259865 RepID=UPI001BAAA182|nr:VOC family protein [Nocardiopsis sp. MG754419]MBR8744595.1 VOC family protein [Nocardiopsis sp. MG754419]
MSLGSVDQWVVNAVAPPVLARFWAHLLGGEAVDRADGWSRVEAGSVRLAFQPTSEPGARDRIHVDVRVEDIAEVTERLVERGATVVGDPVTDAQGSFQVLRDPEGNAFCLVRPADR